jgi:myo-inositol-1(or 4)-monophosphatase
MFPLLNQKIPLTPREDDLRRIARALGAAKDMASALRSEGVTAQFKSNNDPVTIMDQALDQLLRNSLPNGDEGWLSEETADDRSRLEKHRVWIVDPLDGTREFVAGIPEWCISIGLVEDGRAVAGGICNPATGQMFLGSIETGLIVTGHLPSAEPRTETTAPLVLASRSEVNRGEWKHFVDAPFVVVPMGSVAYKLARVAAGMADATCTLVPKHEWDVAAGVALVLAAGGEVETLDGVPPEFNRCDPLFTGLLAYAPSSPETLKTFWRAQRQRFPRNTPKRPTNGQS